MKTWSSKELTEVAAGDELELATVGPDGTLRRPVTVWVVRFGDDLYIRSRTLTANIGSAERCPDGTWSGHGVAPGIPVYVAIRSGNQELERVGTKDAVPLRSSSTPPTMVSLPCFKESTRTGWTAV